MHTNTSIYSSQVLRIGLRSTLRQPKNLQLRWRQWETIIASKRLAHFSPQDSNFQPQHIFQRLPGWCSQWVGLPLGQRVWWTWWKARPQDRLFKITKEILKPSTLHFTDNYSWPWSRWRNIWREREQRDRKACRSGSSTNKKKFYKNNLASSGFFNDLLNWTWLRKVPFWISKTWQSTRLSWSPTNLNIVLLWIYKNDYRWTCIR